MHDAHIALISLQKDIKSRRTEIFMVQRCNQLCCLFIASNVIEIRLGMYRGKPRSVVLWDDAQIWKRIWEKNLKKESNGVVLQSMDDLQYFLLLQTRNKPFLAKNLIFCTQKTIYWKRPTNLKSDGLHSIQIFALNILSLFDIQNGLDGYAHDVGHLCIIWYPTQYTNDKKIIFHIMPAYNTKQAIRNPN